MINWKVRFANKAFWLSLIPAVLLLIQVVADPTTKGMSDSTQALTYDKPKEG